MLRQAANDRKDLICWVGLNDLAGSALHTVAELLLGVAAELGVDGPPRAAD